MSKEEKYIHRDISWLSFNERVLLEAANNRTPLLERLKFLAIFSSNLDEYFKVRISQLRQLKKVDKPLRKKLVLKPNKKLKYIFKTVDEQQQKFGKTAQDIFERLKRHHIHFKQYATVNEEQRAFMLQFFQDSVRSDCKVFTADENIELKDGVLYLAVSLEDKITFVSIPANTHKRFVQVPGEGYQFVLLDDVVRMGLPQLLQKKFNGPSYSIKLSRDAELYLEDDYTDATLVDKIYASLDKRKSGQPTRLLYDSKMPVAIKKLIRETLHIGKVDMFPGGSYHNFSDFFGFGNPLDNDELQYDAMAPIVHPLSQEPNIFEAISRKDHLIHFPYHDFSVVEKFISDASKDPQVTHIKISLYRIAKKSVLTDALLHALDQGKDVTIFVEAKARFDERNNIEWGRIFKDKGAKVLFSIPNIKVHSKIAMVQRTENKELSRYAYISTGNFNSKTSKIYCDHGLFTANQQITDDLNEVFAVLERKLIIPKLKQLLVSPFNARTTFIDEIENEIEHSLQGRPSAIYAKMNSLEDTRMINALYRASSAGVKVRLLVRGICRLVPKPANELEEGETPIVITSIIDRFLEHGRIYLFHNNGDEKMYMGSADWMTRNLDRRIEVLSPILDKTIFDELKHVLHLQLTDNEKAKIIDETQCNRPVSGISGIATTRSQYAIYDFLKNKEVYEAS